MVIDTKDSVISNNAGDEFGNCRSRLQESKDYLAKPEATLRRHSPVRNNLFLLKRPRDKESDSDWLSSAHPSLVVSREDGSDSEKGSRQQNESEQFTVAVFGQSRASGLSS